MDNSLGVTNEIERDPTTDGRVIKLDIWELGT
jgi:hypothetical protein